MLRASRILVATLWVGALWTIGFIVAPTLFSTLGDRELAGSIAGNLFRVMAWLSIGCGVFLLLTQRLRTRTFAADDGRPLHWLVIAMMACTVLGYFCLQPFMAELREALHGLQDPVQIADLRRQFGLLHGASTVVYVVQSLLGVALIVKVR
ncbi:hypothetical protein GCM10007205_12740 [Oxalicibacterium flavum]|uniref:TMEM205-like domain-containing protein n=1 Tax=Oxalicibacterium flavum TaxID=179467 RepID=A0A8J2UNF3_9BURK|nr:DUF4149 domain-containing protein [Oxalicibacterium flavum]GGC04984.1 hypothetical protein GCM10007205_12740 [Oxalicibacterium flavum]